MSESDITPSSGLPDKLEDLNFYLDAKRIYEELGSRKDCQPLIDENPKLIYENEIQMRLHKHDGKLKNCKVYIFDSFLIIGSQRLRKRKTENVNENSTGMTTTSSSDSGVVFFGSDKLSETSSDKGVLAENVDYDSDISYFELAQDLRKESEEEERKRLRKYNMKMWIDLGKVKPNIVQTNERWGIKIIFRSKTQIEVKPGEFRYDIVVDEAQMWIDDETTAKTVFGIVQEVVDKKAMEQIRRINKERKERAKKASMTSKTDEEKSDTDTDGTLPKAEFLGRSSSKLSSKSGSSASFSSAQSNRKARRRKARQRLQQKKEEMLLLQAKFAMKDGHKVDVGIDANMFAERRRKRMLFDRKIESEEKGIATADEGQEAEFTVNFRNAKLEFALTGRVGRIEPFVAKMVPGGLAEMSGITLGDRIVAVNDVEITPQIHWKDCVQIIAKERESGSLRITFMRKQKNELQRIAKEEEQKKANEEEKNRENGEVEPEDEDEDTELKMLGKAKTLKIKNQNIELRRKTDMPGNDVPRFTMRRKGKTRRFAKKKKFYEAVKANAMSCKTNMIDRKAANRQFKLHDNCESTFATLLHNAPTKEEKRCVASLQEIYDTEFKYNANLGHIKFLHFQLMNARRNVMCKELKSGRPFCEHRRIRRNCTQESSTREPAIDPKVVKSIFLNLKAIIKINFTLWKTLQERISKLYEKMESEQVKVEIYEVLEAFCSSFNEVAPYLQLYWQYCQRFTAANKKQRELRAENKYFYEIVVPTEKNCKMSLPSLLAKPLQRITRYHLCFKALKEYMTKYINILTQNGASKELLNKMNEAQKKLSASHQTLVKLAEKINDKVGQANLLDQLLEVNEEIGGKGKVENLVVAHRRFVSKHEILFEHGYAKKVEDNGFLYLFNDKLVVAIKRPISVAPTRSVFSFPLKAMRRLGGRATSLQSNASKDTTKPKKKNSVKKQKKLSKKLSLRLSLDSLATPAKSKNTKAATTANNGTNRLSNGSKDSKGSQSTYFDVMLQIPLRNLTGFSTETRKIEETEYFLIKALYGIKTEEGTEVTEFFLFFEELAVRDATLESLKKLQAEDSEKREELLKIRNKKLGIKTRKFAKNHAKNKKSSGINNRMSVKAKESMFSRHSEAV